MNQRMVSDLTQCGQSQRGSHGYLFLRRSDDTRILFCALTQC